MREVAQHDVNDMEMTHLCHWALDADLPACCAYDREQMTVLRGAAHSRMMFLRHTVHPAVL